MRPVAPTRYDIRPQRTEALRNRYPMPREITQDMHQAIEQAQRTHGGKVLSADRLRNDGRDVYRVKLLTPGGRVRVVQLTPTEPSIAPESREQQGEQ
ncbi:MAG: PepSY domain-containing protein [Rhodanobacteraceae bacterium]|nr:PepSY domain-containing protein [Rhodanobacteraceae bacterium]